MLRIRLTKIALGISLGTLFIYTFFSFNYDTATAETDDADLSRHEAITKKFYEKRKNWVTSNLGSLLFKEYEVTSDIMPQKRTFTILVWKYWNWLKNRHVKHYGSGNNPFKDCSVKNCIFTGEDKMLTKADAVIIHLQRGLIPITEQRPRKQRWIFLNDESPNNVFSLAKSKVQIKDFAGVFNWSMSYRSNSDVPVPYGRTVGLEEPIFKNYRTSDITGIIPNWKKKRRDVIATILISNCGVKFRMNFIKELSKHIQVDVYGSCSKNETLKRRCPGHFKSDCEPVSRYLFYLALENSNCHEYLTEKIWHHAYGKGAIPIIMGPSVTDCENLLPPNSYLYIPINSDAEQINKLAKTMTRISQYDDEIVYFHNWRNNFKVVNEHGYFGTQSRHLCRVCEALNYNSPDGKIYTEQDLKAFLDPNLLCG